MTKTEIKLTPEIKSAFELAKKARTNAYAEYSKVKVGAAIKVKGVEELFHGANVEYVVNGISVCAERSALSDMITHRGGKPQIEFLVVCSNTEPALLPCGVCMQALSEFCGPDLEIYIGNKKEIVDKTTLGTIMPHQYSELPKVLDE